MRKYLFIILALVMILAHACQAFDPGSVELGAEFSAKLITVQGEEMFVFSLPDQIRFGAFVSPNASIVARVSSAVVSTHYSTQSSHTVSVGASLYFPAYSQRSWTILEIMGLGDFATGYNDGSQFGIGAGLGLQGKLQSIYPRVEIVFERRFEGEYIATNTFKLLLGFSFYSGQ